ncbi:MAG: AAA family ATPase [Spirochaeta sp.]|nr:AAA family ATPase [Spirochaeta sp.]
MIEKNNSTNQLQESSGEELPAEQSLRAHSHDYTFAISPEEVQAGMSASEQTTEATETGLSGNGENGEFGIIGQPRALRALRMALEIRNRGYNVIVTGPSGVGKRTAVERVLTEFTGDTSDLRDIAYVYNFSCPHEPHVLYFEPGNARKFRSGLSACVALIQRNIELIELHGKAIEPELRAATRQLSEEFPVPAVKTYLDAFTKDILENLTLFMVEGEAPGAEPATGAETPDQLQRYGVNIVVDHTDSLTAPVVFESNPDYHTMFGSIEPMHGGDDAALPGYQSLRVGAVAKASGGFLVLRAEDLFTQEDVWQACKRVLQDGITEIRTMPGPQSSAGLLRPEPIEVRFKLIVTAAEQVYDALYYSDEDFGKLFKVTAEFDSVMPRNADTTARYIAFVRMIAAQEALLEPEASGIAAILEQAVRLSEFRNLYSTRFSRIADLLRESDYCARRSKAASITQDSVEAAVAERAYLSNLPEEKIDEQILSGELLVTVSGMAVGCINGLAILDRGYYAFARPMLITARTAPGSEGIVNIERESGLSGEIHDKGVYILEGYLRSKYAQDFPLSVRGSICFEQSYIEVDGDSASSSEVYVLLSSIAELPLRQDIAVTGSVNQMGQIQAVGGINEKIEGFYQVCCKLGLSGSQGVIIPRGNLANLMPSRTLQRALDEGTFQIWSVASVDEAMEVLTGLEAGGRTLKGGSRGGSVNALVERRLREMAQQMKSFGAL